MTNKAPRHLDKLAKEYFNEHASQTTDYKTLELLADAYSTWRSAQENLQQQQKLVNGDEINPAFQIYKQAQDSYVKLLKTIKLSPPPPDNRAKVQGFDVPKP